MTHQKAYLLKCLVALFCCLSFVYAVLNGLGWLTEPAQSSSDEQRNTLQTNTTSIDSVKLNREVTSSKTNGIEQSQIPDRPGVDKLQAVQEYVNYSQWCHLENMQAKKPDMSCDKITITQNDANFQRQAEQLALAGDKSSQLALGLWWHEKAKQTLADYNISAKNDNIVKHFDFNNAANAADHSAYLAGATLKKQAREAQRWLTSLAASHTEAADALESLAFQGMLP